MQESQGSMHLRTLQTIDALDPSPSNTVLLALPLELTDALKRFAVAKEPPAA